jgi:ligand-binding sensor domain-containing protein
MYLALKNAVVVRRLNLILLLVGCIQLVMAQQGAQDTFQYKISHWTTDDGLPSNTITYLHQDADEYLWIGSYDGLIRFDGTQFLVFNKNNTPELQSFHARVLKGDRNNNMWIGTSLGLVKYNNGKFINVSGEENKLFILSMWVDEINKKIWIGTRDSGLYCYDIDNNTFRKVDNNFANDLITAIVQDRNGGMWIGSEKNGLAYFKNQQWTYFDKDDGLTNTEIQSLYLDDTDELLVGTSVGLFVFKDGKIVQDKLTDGLRVNKIRRDKEGKIWLATATGAFRRLNKGSWQIFSKDEGLSNNDIRDIYFDNEGSVWLATYRGGLNQLRQTKFVTFGANEGLNVEAIGAIEELTTNQYLVATTDGKLFSIKDNIVSPFILKTKFTQRIYGILKDTQMNLWIASYDGLLLVTPNGNERLFTEADGLPTRQLRMIYQDKNQNYWIASRNSGLIKMKFDSKSSKPVFELFNSDGLKKLNASFIMSVKEDESNNLLVTTNTGGLLVLKNNVIKNYTTDNGLVSNTVYTAQADKQGVIWLATLDGISRLENGEFFNYTKREGMPHESVFDLVEDDSGYFWMPTSNGILRVSKQQLNDYQAGKIKTIEWKQFDRSNELRSSECTGVTPMFKASDNSLWFLMLGGIVKVNPNNIVVNDKAPNVFIEKLIVDDNVQDLTDELIIPSGSQRVVFNYIGINLRYPRSVKYKFRLTNFDKNWIETGTDRNAVYTNLKGGNYTFQVIACNNDGVWNTTGASFPFTVESRYYERWWFYPALIFVTALFIVLYIQLRTRSIKHRADELKRVVDLRTREIALQRDELVALNEELRSSQEEVMAQRDALSDKNNEIERINLNLERLVAARTEALEQQNKRLAEYAFINAHKLRSPLASILGIINLMVIETDPEQKRLLLGHLQKASLELDEIVHSINRMLEEGLDSK